MYPKTVASWQPPASQWAYGYAYDANGQRVAKAVLGAGGRNEVSAYGQNGRLLLYDNDGQSGWREQVYLGDRLVAQRRSSGGVRTFYLTDALGSPRVASSAYGVVLWRENYRPWGQRNTKSADMQTDPLAYTAQPFDDETSLLYLGARYHHVKIGRFYQMDPVHFTEDNSHSFNRFAYANNNPYRFVDPEGLEGFAFGDIGDSAFGYSLSSGDLGDTLRTIDDYTLGIRETVGNFKDVWNAYERGSYTDMAVGLGMAGINAFPAGRLGKWGHTVYRELSATDRINLENGFGLTPKGSGGSIGDQIRGENTGYISASKSIAATKRFSSGNGLVAIDVDEAMRTGTGFVDHNNVLQGAARSGDLRAVRDAKRAQEVLFKGAIPAEAITLIR